MILHLLFFPLTGGNTNAIYTPDSSHYDIYSVVTDDYPTYEPVGYLNPVDKEPYADASALPIPATTPSSAPEEIIYTPKELSWETESGTESPVIVRARSSGRPLCVDTLYKEQVSLDDSHTDREQSRAANMSQSSAPAHYISFDRQFVTHVPK